MPLLIQRSVPSGVRADSVAATNLPLCPRIPVHNLRSEIIPTSRLAWLPFLLEAEGSDGWVLRDSNSSTLLRSAIFDDPVAAAASEAEFADEDRDAEGDVRRGAAAEAESQQENAAHARQRKAAEDKARKEAVVKPFTWEHSEDGRTWANAGECLKLWARKNKLRLDPLRAKLLTNDQKSHTYQRSSAADMSFGLRVVPEAAAVAARCAAEEAASEVEGADASAAEEVSRAENDDLMLSADSSDDDDDEVIEIRGQKGRGSRLRYLVLWSDKSETWEPRRNLNGCVDKLKDFLDNGSQGPSVALSPYELDRLARIRRNEEEAARFDISSLPNSAEFDTIDSPSPPPPAACPPTLSPTFSDQSDDDLLHQPDGDLLPPGTQPNAAHKHPQLTTPPSTPRSKRNQCSPAIGSPAEQPPILHLLV